MIPGAVPAIVVAGALAAVCLVGLVWRRARRWLPEMIVLATATAVIAVGAHPLGPARSELWRQALQHPAALVLIVLALFRSQLAITVRSSASAAAVGGLLVGWLPAVALVVPGASSPRLAARYALIATATSAASPLGSPAQLLVVDASPAYSLYALVPALLAAAIAWPWEEAPRWPDWSAPVWAAGLLGALSAWLWGGLAGVTVAAGVALLAIRGGDRPRLLGRGTRLRFAVAAHLGASLAVLGGVGWFGAWAVHEVLPWADSTLLMAGAAALGAALAEPTTLAAVTQRIAETALQAPEALWRPLTLLLALSPVPALLGAAAVHGRGVLRTGLPLGLAQVALALGWVALVT